MFSWQFRKHSPSDLICPHIPCEHYSPLLHEVWLHGWICCRNCLPLEDYAFLWEHKTSHSSFQCSILWFPLTCVIMSPFSAFIAWVEISLSIPHLSLQTVVQKLKNAVAGWRTTVVLQPATWITPQHNHTESPMHIEPRTRWPML